MVERLNAQTGEAAVAVVAAAEHGSTDGHASRLGATSGARRGCEFGRSAVYKYGSVQVFD